MSCNNNVLKQSDKQWYAVVASMLDESHLFISLHPRGFARVLGTSIPLYFYFTCTSPVPLENL